MSTAIRKGRYVEATLSANLVFVTKIRGVQITPAVSNVLLNAFHRVCASFDAKLMSMHCEDDYVHLEVVYPPTVPLSRLVNSLKGVSARMVRKHLPDEVTPSLWQGHFWSPSYFAASRGSAPSDDIRSFVDGERRRPADAPIGQKFVAHITAPAAITPAVLLLLFAQQTVQAAFAPGAGCSLSTVLIVSLLAAATIGAELIRSRRFA